MAGPIRILALWCPDWPVVAWGVSADEPAVVLSANRVVAATRAARSDGVSTGLRRREAQARCPRVRLLDRDPAREARAFEPLVRALDAVTPRVELHRPGRASFPAGPPARHLGGDESLAARVMQLVEEAFGSASGPEVRVGVAEGAFAARTAARRAVGGPLIVRPGTTPAFLADLPVSQLRADDPRREELVDLLERLGLRTLGAVAALDPADMAGRFGAQGLEAWRLTWGDDDVPSDAVAPPADLRVLAELDPPAERVDAAAFVVRGLADEFHGALTSRGLACESVVVVAETEHGERIERCWRHEGILSAAAVAQRLRWQLEGWLSGRGAGGSPAHRVPLAERLQGGVVRLELIPDRVVGATGRQLGFWGGRDSAAERARRALARVEGLLGADAVLMLEPAGGRAPGEGVVLVAYDTRQEHPRGSPGAQAKQGVFPLRVEPWPGRLPAPAPAVVHDPPLPAQVLDVSGRRVGVNGRGEPSAPPMAIQVGGVRLGIESWAGPWPIDERWWDATEGRRRARIQAVTDDGVARLYTLEAGAWGVEATYD
ncbi:MAG: DNA polymerase Y family protein [Microthrixaceae bacterium]